jgi:hypothetical protein
MAIPFRSLRFPKGEKQPAWGFTLQRLIQRNNEWDFWPAVSKRVSGRLNQAAELRGLEGISHSSNTQFTPYEVFRSFRGLDTTDAANPTYDQAQARFREGLDSKFIFHDSLVLDATVNPDFSQVESDQPQITVNQRFAVYFPEKRPFFLENSSLFDPGTGFLPGVTPSQLVFTRNIQDPEFGARLTGKQGPYTLAFLAVDDRGPGESAAASDPAFNQRAYFAVAHVSREIGSQSSLGAIYTDREFFHGWNRVGGLDGNLKLDPNWNLAFRSVVSSTLAPDGQYSAGPYNEATLTRQGRSFNENLLLQDISPGFQTQVGFVPRTDLRRIADYTGYIFHPVGKPLLSDGPEGTVEVDYDHAGTLIQYDLSTDWAFEFKRQMLVMPVYRIEVDTLRPQDFPGLTRNMTFARDGGGFMIFGTPWKQLQFNVTVNDQGGVNVVPPVGQMPVLGNELSATLTATVNPSARLKIANTYILDRLTANRGENAAFNNHIFRSEWGYQFTPKLSLRLIPQYSAVLANPLYTSLPTTKQMNVDFLITYLVHPGTAVYVGYNSNLDNLNRALCSRLETGVCDPLSPGLLRDPKNFINDGRQFFVKLSYLFRP